MSFLFCALLCFFIAFSERILFYSFLMVCAHESAHLLAMRLCAVAVDAVRLEPFGIIIERQNAPLTLTKTIGIALAGCAANFFLAVCFSLAFFALQKELLLTLSAINACLGIFHILPVSGLDGGQVLTAVLERKRGADFALNTAKIVSAVTCVILFIIGMILCFKVRLNPSLCVISLLLLMKTVTLKYN